MALVVVQDGVDYAGFLGTLAFFLVLYFVVIPLIAASQFWLAVHPLVVPLGRPHGDSPPTLPLPPARVAAFFMMIEEELAGLGFESIAWLECRRAAARAGLHVALFNNGNTGDRVAAMFAVGRVTHGVEMANYVVEIETEAADGRSWNTINAVSPAGHPPPAWRTTWRFPGMTDLRLLYEVHRALLKLENPPKERAVLPLDPADEVAESMIREYDDLVRRGHLRVDPGRTRYKLRLKAVPYSVVGQLWPITTFRRWLMRREARFQLMRLGYSPNYMRGDYSRQIKLRLAGVEDVGNIIET